MKNVNHGLGYGFILTKVFDHFWMKKKQKFRLTILKEFECVVKKKKVGPKASVTNPIVVQEVINMLINAINYYSRKKKLKLKN